MHWVLWLLAGCGGTDSDSDALVVEPVCTEPATLACEDEMILDLSLHDDKVADAEVTTTTDGNDFVTAVEASAGGFGEEANNPWVYVKFTPTGAQRVDIDDETALDSLDWDIAARRFILRLNGGTSGPGCVGAAAFLEQTYEGLSSVPAGLTYVQDDFYTSDCTIVNDSSGLPGSPQVALAPWWSYDSCVATTDHPFLIQLADGNIVKFTVEQYYGTNQEGCNTSGNPGGDSAHFTWRWTFMTP